VSAPGSDQQRLERALARARAGEDRIIAARVREEGAQLVNLLLGVLRMGHMHAADNSAFDKPVQDLTAVLGRLIELLGPVHLAIVEDQCYLNEIRVRTDERNEAPRDLAALLRRHGVGGLTFRDALTDAQLRHLLGAFGQKPAEVRPRTALQATLAARGLHSVELGGLYRFRVSGEEAAALSPGRLRERAASLVDETFQNLGAARLPNPLPIRRAVAEMLAAEEGIEMTGDPQGSSRLAAHSLRVAQLSLLIGQGLGLPEAALQDLGVAAMLHDVGYAAREGQLPGLPGYAPPFERHGTAGVRLVLRQRGFHEAKVRRARAILSVHRDFSARPQPPLFARILRIAEDYDTATRPGGGALSPDEALARLAAGAGSRYDPVLTQIFVNAMGRWPPGTRVTLSDGRPARVVAPSRTPERFERPRVRTGDGEVVDLLEGSLRITRSDWAEAPPAEEDDLVLLDVAPPAATPEASALGAAREAVRALANPDVVRYQLGDLDQVLTAAGDARAADLRDAEQAVLSAVDGGRTAREVLDATPVSADVRQRALLALLLAGLVRR
jgi:hypothetical protein